MTWLEAGVRQTEMIKPHTPPKEKKEKKKVVHTDKLPEHDTRQSEQSGSFWATAGLL